MMLRKTTKEVLIKGDLMTLLEVEQALKDFEIDNLEVRVKKDEESTCLIMKFERNK